ncbi:hypothetical protein QO058_30100 (plasmid) [Bosea vestrisii]|uniref:hypothetical protein n=1 Tax=Bosea vestrisii TaxID=151416 RepID=UPI0024E03F35|nr:hypothetical protein [Bosea vestrisii]WID99661.1 hypothetical protein QO058_30100 [Bosea vestrisii]
MAVENKVTTRAGRIPPTNDIGHVGPEGDGPVWATETIDDAADEIGGFAHVAGRIDALDPKKPAQEIDDLIALFVDPVKDFGFDGSDVFGHVIIRSRYDIWEMSAHDRTALL